MTLSFTVVAGLGAITIVMNLCGLVRAPIRVGVLVPRALRRGLPLRNVTPASWQGMSRRLLHEGAPSRLGQARCQSGRTASVHLPPAATHPLRDRLIPSHLAISPRNLARTTFCRHEQDLQMQDCLTIDFGLHHFWQHLRQRCSVEYFPGQESIQLGVLIRDGFQLSGHSFL